MESSEAITAVRLAAAIAILSYGSLLDWRTRRVSNRYWIVLALIGIVLIPTQLLVDKGPLEYALVLIPILAIFADVYLEPLENSAFEKYGPYFYYSIAITAILALGYLWMDSEYFQHYLGVPVMMLVIVVFYMMDIVRGGADAKALLSLAVLFPFHPGIADLPLITSSTVSGDVFFPFSFVVLINAAIIVAVLPIGFLLLNAARRELGFPSALLGYKMDVADLAGKHVWLMERVEAGVHKSYVKPKREEDLQKEIAALSDAGIKRVWVTPKIPFIIPITLSLVLSTVLGNILFLVIPM